MVTELLSATELPFRVSVKSAKVKLVGSIDLEKTTSTLETAVLRGVVTGFIVAVSGAGNVAVPEIEPVPVGTLLNEITASWTTGTEKYKRTVFEFTISISAAVVRVISRGARVKLALPVV